MLQEHSDQKSRTTRKMLKIAGPVAMVRMAEVLATKGPREIRERIEKESDSITEAIQELSLSALLENYTKLVVKLSEAQQPKEGKK